MKYFTDSVDYPQDVLRGEFLPHNTIWNYVSSQLLLGLVNYVMPIKAYAVGRYHPWDEVDDDPDPLSVRTEDPSKPWVQVSPKTRDERFRVLTTSSNRCFPSLNINAFQQDVIILTRTDKGAKSVDPSYILFWFDQDCSDCSVGRFSTEDSVDQVVAEFDQFVITHRCNHHGAREIPIIGYAGWIV